MPHNAPVATGVRRRPYYLIPTIIGLCGIYFAMQLPSPLRVVVVLLSASVPAFVGGYMLATLPTASGEKRLLSIGTLFLFIGAIVTASGLTESLIEQQLVSEQLGTLSRWMGTFSLFLGLIVMLFSVVRSGEMMEELTDRFRHLASHISEGFILTSRQGIVRLVNRRLLDMTGLDEKDLLGQRVEAIAKALHIEPVRVNPEGGASNEYQVRWSRDGKDRHYWLNASPVLDPRGGVAGTLITVRDVTEQQRLAQRLERYTQGLQKLVEEQTQKLQQSQEQLRGLLVRMREGFLTVDPTFHIRFANDRVCELLHRTESELAGKNIFDFISHDGRPRLLALLEGGGAVEEDERTLYEFTLTPVDGDELAVIIAVAPVTDEDEGGSAYSLVITDITELKTMQRELQRRADELERVNEELRQHGRAKDTFLTNVSHELRTPLSTVQGYVDMFDSGSLGPLQSSQRAALEVMERNLSRLGALINEMINFSRMEIRGIQLNIGLLDPRQLAIDCAGSAKPQALAKSLHLHLDAQNDLPPIWGDRQKLAQALTILLSNAVKFTDEGGTVTLHCALNDEGAIVFTVSDTGIGIAPAFQSLVFVKFFQVDSSKSRRYEGAGIGLTIAKSIVEGHRGKIELTSEAGNGSSFAVILPNAIFRAGTEAPPTSRLQNLHVHLGISDAEFREALRRALASFGCRTTEADRAYECVRAARETIPDVIILDAQLHDLDTSGVVDAIRDMVATTPIPILLIEHVAPQVTPELEELPEVRVVRVPFTVEELAAHIERAVSTDREETSQPAAAEVPGPSLEGGVLLVSGDYDFVEWLDMALRRRKRRCTVANDLTRAAQLAHDAAFDAAVLDADLLDPNLDEAIAVIRKRSLRDGLPVYVTTARPLKPGEGAVATAILEKPFPLDAFLKSL